MDHDSDHHVLDEETPNSGADGIPGGWESDESTDSEGVSGAGSLEEELGWESQGGGYRGMGVLRVRYKAIGAEGGHGNKGMRVTFFCEELAHVTRGHLLYRESDKKLKNCEYDRRSPPPPAEFVLLNPLGHGLCHRWCLSKSTGDMNTQHLI